MVILTYGLDHHVTSAAITYTHTPFLHKIPSSYPFIISTAMGSSQSYISSEAALTAAVIAGALVLGYSQYGHSPTTTRNLTPSSAGKAGKKKKQPHPELKKDSTESSLSQDLQLPQVKPIVVPFPAVIPGEFDLSAAAPVSATNEPASKPKKGKKKKGKAASGAIATSSADTRSESSAGVTLSTPPENRSSSKSKRQGSSPLSKPLKQSTTSIDTDGSWTRVESRRRNPPQVSSGSASTGDGHQHVAAELTHSDAGGITTSVTGNSSPITERTEDEGMAYNDDERYTPGNRRTLAEKLLPKPRSTAVDEYVKFLLMLYSKISLKLL